MSKNSLLDSAGDFKAYCDEIGPKRAHPPRPAACEFCGFERVWFNGWRKCYPTRVVCKKPTRAEKGAFLQKVRCARPECGRSWTVYPGWMSAHQSYQADVVEQTVLEYASGVRRSYAATARACECSSTAIWLWVGWIARVACPKKILAKAGRLGAFWGPDLVPREAAASRRARSPERGRIVMRALRVLSSLTCLHRAQPEPPNDPSPLGWFLGEAFPAFRKEGPPPRRCPSPAIERRGRPRPG